jgi:pimeloyl-ACP methyl ester carboxylesterase
MTVLLVTLVAIGLAIVWFVGQQKLALPGEPATKLSVTTADGWTLSLWYRAPKQVRFVEPILFCHGLANNHFFFDFGIQNNLMRAACALGFRCYAIDFRGSGSSLPTVPGPFEVSIDDHIQFDAPAAVACVLKHAQAPQAIWVGHSLGGLIGLAAIPKQLKGKIKALVTIGSPGFFHLDARTSRLLKGALWLCPWGQLDLQFIRWLAPFAGLFRFKKLLETAANADNLSADSRRWAAAHTFAPMWKGVLAQLETWTSRSVFVNTDNTIDYQKHISDIDVPALTIGGSVDQLASPEATQRLHERLPHSQYRLFGLTSGDSVDYGHGDLILGNRAENEVFPVILAFVISTATSSTDDAESERGDLGQHAAQHSLEGLGISAKL